MSSYPGPIFLCIFSIQSWPNFFRSYSSICHKAYCTYSDDPAINTDRSQHTLDSGYSTYLYEYSTSTSMYYCTMLPDHALYDTVHTGFDILQVLTIIT